MTSTHPLTEPAPREDPTGSRVVDGAPLGHDGTPVHLATGTGTSPDTAVGRLALDADVAQRWARNGDPVVLVRRETTADDLRGMAAATGILTSRGDATSHAAVVARGTGRTCVHGVGTMDLDLVRREVTFRGGPVLHEGEMILLDGSTGEVFRGCLPVGTFPFVQHAEGGAA
jgi:pyruvate,orthophosphate dikinase